MYDIKWLNFNSALFVVKSHILATICVVSNGGDGEWSVEAGAVGAPNTSRCPPDYLSFAQRLAARDPAHPWLLSLQMIFCAKTNS